MHVYISIKSSLMLKLHTLVARQQDYRVVDNKIKSGIEISGPN